jgi:hypothetical protein
MCHDDRLPYLRAAEAERVSQATRVGITHGTGQSGLPSLTAVSKLAAFNSIFQMRKSRP